MAEIKHEPAAAVGAPPPVPSPEVEERSTLSPASSDQGRNPKDVAEEASLAIIEWMASEGLLRHRTSNVDALEIKDMILRALQSPSTRDGGGDRLGRDPTGQAAQQSPSPDGLGPSGEHPSREGMVPLADLAAHHGRDWRLWWHGLGPERGDHIMELRQGGGGDAREVAYLGDQYHGTLTTLVYEHNEQVRRLREVIARQRVAKDLLQKEVADLRARDQRASREDGVSQPRPEAASLVDDANSGGEAPAGLPAMAIPDGWEFGADCASHGYWSVTLVRLGDGHQVKGASTNSMPDAQRKAQDLARRAPGLRLAEGCCSAASPCSHQKRSPYTICDICQKAARPSQEKSEGRDVR